MSLVKTISNYRNAYSNWFSILNKMYRTRNVKDKTNVMIKVRLKGTDNILNVPWREVSSYSSLKLISNPRIRNVSIDNHLISFSYDNYNLKFDMGNGGELEEAFFNEAYKFLKVEGKDVIDIGANIGDTAIYFAIKGATKVISLEPYPYTFALAVKNIGVSGFKDKIEIINAGYGEDKKVKIDTSFIPDNSSVLRENKNGRDTNLYSLKTLMSKYNIDSGILKMDCEGCEYHLLNEDDETIKKFSMIQIEYHYGYEKLVGKLRECGFKCNYTEPKKSNNLTAVVKTMMIGYIFAENDSNHHS